MSHCTACVGRVGESIAESLRGRYHVFADEHVFIGVFNIRCLEIVKHTILTRQQNKNNNLYLPQLPCLRYLLALTTGSVMSESAATAWIIERLEMENTKMEEEEEEEVGNMDTCEENSGATLRSSLPLFADGTGMLAKPGHESAIRSV